MLPMSRAAHRSTTAAVLGMGPGSNCGPETFGTELCLATGDAGPAANGAFFLSLSQGVAGRGVLSWGISSSSFGALISPSASGGATMAEEQRDLISSDSSSGVLPTGTTERSTLGRKTALSAVSILVALLIAGQAVTIYYVYQQSGQISKLTKTSQSLKLEALQRRMPTNTQPANKIAMSMMNMPMAMKVLPLAPSVGDMPMEAMRPRSNKTEDQVRHLLLKGDPRKTFPELKDDMLGNLKRLKKNMSAMDWQDFEAWMHKWLLFEMAKGPKVEEQNAIPAEKAPAPTEPEEMIFSGVDMPKAAK
uniref:CD74 molecule n=1 Tax=Pavo cristatus TaxID=9049 RepID=A0A8C9ESD0_PAVCR